MKQQNTFKLAGAFLGGAACAYLIIRWGRKPLQLLSSLSAKARTKKQLEQRHAVDYPKMDHDRDAVDQASWESFPASDPPSYY